MLNTSVKVGTGVPGAPLSETSKVPGTESVSGTPKVLSSNVIPSTGHNAIRARAERLMPGTYKEAILAAAAESGFPTPNEVQLQTCESLARGRDTLLVLSTGGGKSLPPQLVTARRKKIGLGLTLAVGPLNALASDQFRRAKELNLAARMWNSTVSDGEKARTLESIERDMVDILFTTAESLQGLELQHALLGNVGLAWIDESHTTIDSGHFRPAQARIGKILDYISPTVRYACTATSQASQEAELIARCGLRNPNVIRAPISRPNLSYFHIERSSFDIRSVLREYSDARAIVYCATVKSAQTLAMELQGAGFKAAAYTGSLTKTQRAEIEQAFQQRVANVIVGTDAFGLGIDFPDVRAVVCYDPACDVSGFFQQAGRAGRDGKASDVFICSKFAAEGWRSREWLIKASFPTIDDMQDVWRYLQTHEPSGIQDTQKEIAEAAGIKHAKHTAGQIFRHLKQRRLITEQHTGKEYTYHAAGAFGAVDWLSYHAAKQTALNRLNELRNVWDLPESHIPQAIEHHFNSVEA